MIVPFAVLGLVGFLLIHGGVAGFIEYASSPTGSRLRADEATTLQGAAGNFLKHFLGFAVVLAWSWWLGKAPRRKVSIIAVTAGVLIVLLVANFNYNRGTMLAPIVGLAAAFSAHVWRIPFKGVILGSVLALSVAFSFGWYRSTDLDITELSGSAVADTWNAEDVVANVQIYASGPQMSAYLIESLEGKFFYGKTLFPSLVYPIPVLGKPYRDISGTGIFNELIYGDTNSVNPISVDQIIPLDGELYINFHLAGAVLGNLLLGCFLAWLQGRFMAAPNPVESYAWLMMALWTVFPGSLAVASQIYVYSFWPIYSYFVAKRLWSWNSATASHRDQTAVSIRVKAIRMKICLVGGIFDRPEAVRSKQLVTPETVLLDGFRKAGVEVHAVGHAGFQPSDEYDIIHVHHFGRAALKMASSHCRARVVFTGHNGLIPTGWERSRLRRYAFQYVVDKAEAYIALSHAEARYYARVTNADKIHTIPNGIPPDVFRAAGHLQKRADKERYDVLYVGQLIDWKGVNFLLEAMQQLRKQRHVHLRLVYHNAHLEAKLRQQANNLGIAEHVEFVGIRGPNELAGEYHLADLLVLPSFADCLPSVVTEAFLCGTPVVAGGVCGVPEQIGPYGLAVPPGNSVALADAMETILADRPRWQGMAAQIRAYAEHTFKPETMVARHLALYRDMIEGRTVPAKRQSAWIDPAVRLAVKVYWRHRRGAP